MIAKLYALFGILALVGAVAADTCGRAVCHTPVVTASVYIPTVAMPAYGASYNAGGTENDEKLAAVLEKILARLEAIEARQAGAEPAAGVQGVKDDPVPTLVKHCAGCHTAGSLKVGTEYSMFTPDGKILFPSPPERKAIRERAVVKRDMPPVTKPKLTVEEHRLVEGFTLSPPAPTVPKKK